MILRKIGPYVVEQAPEGLALRRDADKDRRGRLVFAAAAAAVAVASHLGGAPLPFVVMVSASAAFAAMQSMGAARSPARLFLSRDGLRLRRGDPSEDRVWPKEKILRVLVEQGRPRGPRHAHRQTGPRWRVRVEIDGADNGVEYAFATREGADEMAAFVAGELGVPVEG